MLRYLAAETPPASKPRYIPSKLDSFLPYLKERVAHGCTHTRQLWHEIQQQGYDGSAQQLDKWLRLQRRKASQNHTTSRPSDESQTSWPAPRTGARVMLSCTENLTPADTHLLTVITQDERLKLLRQHAQQFLAMIHRRDVQQFDAWLHRRQDVALRPYRYFVQSLKNDMDAVKAAIISPWSNGQTEGQIHRLKFPKRQMYGRAKLDLLKIRLMYPAAEHHICA